MEEEQPGHFSSLDLESLVAICSRLDGRSLAHFQLINSDARQAAKSDAPWRSAFEREFPTHFQYLQRNGFTGPWRQAYSARQHAEGTWAAGGPDGPQTLLRNAGRCAFGLDILQDPFPADSVIAGYIIASSQAGEVAIFDLARDTAARGDTLNNAGDGHDLNVNVHPRCIATPHKYNSNNSSADADNTRMPTPTTSPPPTSSSDASNGNLSGIFHLAQRPLSNEVAVTMFDTKVAVIRLHDNRNGGEGDEDMDGSDDTNNTNSNTEWSYECLYNLLGHHAGCATVRAVQNRILTASYDGVLRLFTLPPPQTSPPRPHNHPTPSTSPTYAATKEYYDDPAHTAPLSGEPDLNRGVCGADLSADLSKIVSGSNDMQIKLWDTESGKILLRLTGDNGWPWWVKGIDPDLCEVVSASTSGFVRVWDMRGGVQAASVSLSQRQGHPVFPASSAVSSLDKRYLVCGSFDTHMHVVDRRMMRVLKSIGGHEQRLSRVCAQGDVVLSSGFDGIVGVFDFR